MLPKHGPLGSTRPRLFWASLSDSRDDAAAQ
jgi:hypothetical protein